MALLQYVAWVMSQTEENFLNALSPIVDLWLVRPYNIFDGIFYLTEEDARAGMHALAYSAIAVVMLPFAIRREHILAVDLERNTAQVVLAGATIAANLNAQLEHNT